MFANFSLHVLKIESRILLKKKNEETIKLLVKKFDSLDYSPRNSTQTDYDVADIPVGRYS